MIAEALDDRGVSLKVSTNRHAMTLSCTCLPEDFDSVLAVIGGRRRGVRRSRRTRSPSAASRP